MIPPNRTVNLAIAPARCVCCGQDTTPATGFRAELAAAIVTYLRDSAPTAPTGAPASLCEPRCRAGQHACRMLRRVSAHWAFVLGDV